MSFLHILFLLLLCSFSNAIDFSCPTQNITNGNGVFPPGTQNLTVFPVNYHCEIGFEIPDGFAVKIETNGAVTDSGDYMTIVNSLNKKGDRSDGPSTYFAPAKSAWVVLNSASGTAKFFIKYQYIDLRNYQRTYFSTGTVFPLDSMNNNAITVMSPKGQSIIMNTDSYAWKDDIFTSNIYVYDGADVTAPFIGTLFGFANSRVFRQSSGSSLTLVNLYGTSSPSYAVANEYLAVHQFSTYDFYVFANDFPFENTFADFLGDSNAITFYCIKCTESYMTNLQIATDGQYRSAQFYPLTPSNRLDTFLTYSSKDNLNNYLPQLIPGNLFTVTTDAKKLTVQIDNQLQSGWVKPFPGRRGTVFSPSLWTPGASPAYDWKFESTTPLKFTFNIQSAIIASPGEQISVQIGTAGSAPFTTTFTNSVANPGVRVANGTYMQVTYTGTSTDSSSIVTFNIDNPDGSTSSSSTVLPSSGPGESSTIRTTGKMETTTKTSGKLSIFVTFLSIFMAHFLIL